MKQPIESTFDVGSGRRAIQPLIPQMGFFSRHRRGSDEPGLLDAAKRADVEAVRKLLDGGANPDVRDRIGYTPLMQAVSRVTEPTARGIVIDLLIDSGADVTPWSRRARVA